ncbi:hypothetical protein CPC08DRAFT_249772 [Agrocybe pediades]|nr:hypothetical protein CPC08DRAFT_249772 [Agrocybe pediades]
MYRFVITFCKNILHALSFEGTTDIMFLALVKTRVRIPEAAAHFCVAVSRALNTFSAIALRATGIVALAMSFSFQHSPSPMSSTFSPASEYLVGYFKDNFSSSTRYVFEIALANNSTLQQLGQSITIPNVPTKPNQPLARRTPLLLTYKPVEVEKESSTTEPSSQDKPVALKLVTIQLVDVGTTSATTKTLEAKRPQPLLLITYKSVEVDETSATKKEDSDEKPQEVEPLTENPVEVEDASEEQLVDVSETSAIETPEDQPSTPVPATVCVLHTLSNLDLAHVNNLVARWLGRGRGRGDFCARSAPIRSFDELRRMEEVS